jgi:hypothetical protein
MDTDGPVPLTYLPVRFRRRQLISPPNAIGWAAFDAMAVMLCLSLHLGPTPLALLGALNALAATCLAVAAWRGWTFEVRVEGDMLVLASPRMPAISVPVADVRRVTYIRSTSDAASWYELDVRGRGRLRVEADLLQPIGPVRAAVTSANSAVRFVDRPDNECGGCGEPIWTVTRLPGGLTMTVDQPRDRCPVCGASVPRPGQFA